MAWSAFVGWRRSLCTCGVTAATHCAVALTRQQLCLAAILPSSKAVTSSTALSGGLVQRLWQPRPAAARFSSTPPLAQVYGGGKKLKRQGKQKKPKTYLLK